MDKSEIIRYKDNLLNTLLLKGEYDAASGLRRKVLMVEGATDQAFVEHIKSHDTRCIAVAEFMRARSAFSTSRTPITLSYNCKRVITTILKHIALFPEYFDFPKGAERWPLYGLVDNDFDDSREYMRVTKLFWTDTHDLETLLIATDRELLTKIDQCTITTAEVKSALYVAQQLSAFRQAIKSNGTLNPTDISESNGTIEFDAFTEGDRINLMKLLEYVSNKAEKPLSREKLKRTCETIKKDMRRFLDKEGYWKKTLDSFEVDENSSLWMEINGHDILSAICYKNPSVKRVFINAGGYTQNRDFEFALSAAYNYDCLKKTKLYSQLQAAGLLLVC